MRRMSVLGLLSGPGCVPHLYTQDGPITAGIWEAPENGWEVSEPPSSLVGEGFSVGDTAPDLRLRDQFGDEVSLWQFYGQLILLDVSTLWCVPCQALAEHTEETWESYRDQGFVYLTLLQEDFGGLPPEPDDIQLWVDQFGLSSPVLADGDRTAIEAVPVVGGAVAYPGVLLIGRDLEVLIEPLSTPDHQAVEEAILSAL